MASIRKKLGSKHWYACFYLAQGKRTQRSTKTTDRKKALRIAMEWEDAALNKLTEAQMRRVLSEIHLQIHGRPLASASLAAYRDQWLARKKGETEPATFAAYKGALDHFVETMGPRAADPIHYVQTADIAAWRDAGAVGKSSKTANNRLKVLRVFFGTAWKDGLITENPAAKVSSLKVDEGKRRPFTMGEIRKMLEVASDEWKALIVAGLYTGQRLRDLALLTWANIDLVNHSVVLTTRKTKRRQILPITAPLREALSRLPSSDNPTAPLFQNAFAVASKTDTSRLSQQFHDILVAAGLAAVRGPKAAGTGKGRTGAREQNEVTFHSLRHTATSWLKNAGVPEAVAMDLIGHESKAMSQHYTRIDEATKRSAVERLPNIFSA